MWYVCVREFAVVKKQKYRIVALNQCCNYVQASQMTIALHNWGMIHATAFTVLDRFHKLVLFLFWGFRMNNTIFSNPWAVPSMLDMLHGEKCTHISLYLLRMGMRLS